MRRIARLIVVAAALTALLGVFGGSATAAHRTGASATPFSPRVGNISGALPPRTGPDRSGDRYVDLCPCLGSGDLIYRGGPVMLTNRTYNIYWQPTDWVHPFPVGYRQKIDEYLADVAYDSSLRTNVYATDTQYYDTIGGTHNIAYNSTYGGSVLDTSAYPPSGCTDTVAQTTICLTDAQLRTEIDSVVSAHGWPRGLGAVYFLYTPLGVGSTYGTNHFAYVNYCAYHSSMSSGGITLYANMPFTKSMPGCDAGEYPNGAATGADPTINTLSHEHNEAITDPAANAWRDAMGYENGDKCAWSFGTLSGVAGSRYNQVVNGHHYLTQLEWNNSGATPAAKCAGSMPALPPTITGFSPHSGAIGSVVTIDGTGFGGVSAVRFHGAPATFSVNSGMRISARVPAGATTGTITVTTPAGASASPGKYTVLPPTISGFSPASGKTGTIVTINGTNLAGVNSVKNGLMPMTILTNSGTWMTARIREWGTYNPQHPISVSSSAGSATSASNFVVTFGIANVTPTHGAKGDLVTLSGRGFNANSRVAMSKDPTPPVVPTSVWSNGMGLTFNVPAGWAGAHQLTVTNSTGVTGTVYSYWIFTKN